jgi:hypothetical protein
MTPKSDGRGFVILRAAGLVLLVAVASYGAYLLWTHRFVRATPQVLGVGSGFEGNAQLPKEEIDAVIGAGRQKVAAKNTVGNRFALLGTLAEWLTFLLSSVITLLAGYQGINSTDDTAKATIESLKARSTRFARIVGTTAAAAAVSTALAGRATTAADGYYKAADELQRKLTSARRQVLEAKSATDAAVILDQLKSDIR